MAATTKCQREEGAKAKYTPPTCIDQMEREENLFLEQSVGGPGVDRISEASFLVGSTTYGRKRSREERFLVENVADSLARELTRSVSDTRIGRQYGHPFLQYVVCLLRRQSKKTRTPADARRQAMHELGSRSMAPSGTDRCIRGASTSTICKVDATESLLLVITTSLLATPRSIRIYLSIRLSANTACMSQCKS